MSTEVLLKEFAEVSEHPYRVLSAYKKEAGSLHRAIGMAVSQSLLAWAVSALFFQIGSLFL